MKFEPATKGQIVFAKEIADVLNLQLPKEPSKDKYWYFINQNILDYEEYTKHNPTQAQIDYAFDICAVLELELPELETKEDYSKFIAEYVDAYKSVLAEMNSDPLAFVSDWALEHGYF